MKIRNTEFDVKNHTYIMGILNVTPDSFSDGGKRKETKQENAKTGRSLSLFRVLPFIPLPFKTCHESARLIRADSWTISA